MRAGHAIRQARALEAAAVKPCPDCGHGLGEHKQPAPSFFSVEGTTVTETPNPAYEPGVFECAHEGCGCRRAF